MVKKKKPSGKRIVPDPEACKRYDAEREFLRRPPPENPTSEDRLREAQRCLEAVSIFDEFDGVVYQSFLRKAKAADRAADCAHSDDFRSAKWFGREYNFTTNQAVCVALLWEH